MDYAWILCIALLLLQMILSKGEDVYCSVNNNVTVEFTVDPPGRRIFWRRDGKSLRDVEVNAAGDGCAAPIVTDPVGYEFDCKTVNNKTVYILKFKSKTEDNGLDFTLSNINPTPTFSYTAYTINGATPSHTDCETGNFKDELTCNVSCNCVKPSLSWKYTTEDQREGSINISGIKPVPCGPGGDHSYKLDINVKTSEIMKLLPDDVTGLVTVNGTLTIGAVSSPIYLFTTLNDSVTTLEPTTQTSSSRMSSEPQTTSLSSSSSSLSSTSSGQDGGYTPSTETSPDHPSSSTATTPNPPDTTPTPSPLTTTEIIVVVVCSCVGFLLLVVLVVCCVILSIRRKNRKRRPPRNKPYSDNSMTRYPYHHSSSSPKTETQKTTSSSKPGSRKPSSSVRPELQYTNYGYYNARPYRNYDNNHRQYRNYDNVYNNHRPYRRDDNRRHREDINMTPYRLYYQPHQYHYL